MLLVSVYGEAAWSSNSLLDGKSPEAIFQNHDSKTKLRASDES